LFLFCSAKTEDEKKEYILIDKFIIWFVNRKPIPIEQNLLIRECVRKHILVSIAVMILDNPKLDNYEYLDQ